VHRGTWKNAERKFAELLGGQRIPVTGRHNQETPDLDVEDLAVEVKARAKLPGLIVKAMQQAECAGEKHNKMPIAIFHEKGKRFLDAYVIIRLDWFLKLYEKWKS
jgi:hypothetical protein